MKILETCLYVDDLDKATEFYTSVLGFRLYSREGNRHVFLTGDDAMLLLFNPSVTANEIDGMVPKHGAFGQGHVCFQIEPGEEEMYEQHLIKHDVEIEKKVMFGPNQSIYFRDPAGNSLEYATRKLWGKALER